MTYPIYTAAHLKRLIFVIPATVLGITGLFGDVPWFGVMTVLIAAGFWAWFIFRDRELRRIRASIRGWTTGGVGVRGVVQGWELSDLLYATELGLEDARQAFAPTPAGEYAWLKRKGFRGKLIQFLPGRLYDNNGAHDIEANVEPDPAGLGNVGILPSDSMDTVRNRVRFLGLRQLLAASGLHGGEADHRRDLERLGIEALV